MTSSDPETKTLVEGHLATCPTCPLYGSLVGVRDAMGELRDPDAVVETPMARRTRERLEVESGRPARPPAAP